MRISGSSTALLTLLAVAVVTSPAQSAPVPVSDVPIVATKPSEIPKQWLELAPAGSCLANPWNNSACPPPKSVTYPSQKELEAQVQAARGIGGAFTDVHSMLPLPASSSDAQTPAAAATTPGAAGSPPSAISAANAPAATAARSAGPRAHAASTIYCDVTTYLPAIYVVNGNYKARGDARIDCPSGFIVAEIHATLMREGVTLATDGGTGVQTAAASARYDCNHTSLHLYATQSLSYFEYIDGTAGTGSNTALQYHTCPG